MCCEEVDVANEYPVILYRRDDGELEKRVVIPESVFTEMTSAEAMAKQARAAGFWTRLRRWFGQKTDEAPDEQTTEIGGVPVADVGGSLAEEETARRDETTRLARYRDYIRMDEDCVELGRALTVTARNGRSSYTFRPESPGCRAINDRPVPTSSSRARVDPV